MRVHVIGGGLAGLSAALALADAGRPVTLYEAGPSCGGRCRSYDDRVLGTRLDNGNHLLLSGNRDAFAFLERLGTADTLGGPDAPIFPFIDLTTSERWTLRLGRGRIPWWLFAPSKRVPGTSLAEHASLLRLLRAGPHATVAECFSAGPLAERLLKPLAIAILNTMPERGSASLLAAVFRDSLMRGGEACIPAFPREGLSESFVDPALAAVTALGADIRLGWRVQSLERDGDRVVRLAGPNGGAPVAAGEHIVLAVPAPVAATLLPGTPTPATFESIINLHFRTDIGTGVASIAGARFVGLVGSLAEWIFLKDGVISVTISAANRFDGLDPDAITASIWQDVKAALALPQDEPMPPARLVREKRATFEATPETEARRAPPKTSVANVTLAGDWTATGLPATIEGAIRSGRTASRLILSQA
jgi:squalene-associated FAD-dependent desaturase